MLNQSFGITTTVRVIPELITKRDGRVVPFDPRKIEIAIEKCFRSLRSEPAISIHQLTEGVVNIVSVKYQTPSVEQVQDVVETVLLANGEYGAARHYIRYRDEHNKMRAIRPVPETVRLAYEVDNQYFPTDLQKFQFYDKFSRFNWDLGRRETWVETVDRAVSFLRELSHNQLEEGVYQRIRESILHMRAVPSMRLLAMAGPAARRQNASIYNCSYLPVESIDAFVEAMIISMASCGVGFSVEGKYVENFPRIKRQTGLKTDPIVVEDSSEGWAESLRQALAIWFDGADVVIDYSRLRPAGAILKTKGGRSSGPEALRKLMNFTRGRILLRQGSFLRPIDAHDIMCAVGNAAVSGGVRRSAMISLFDFDDPEMRLAKSGEFDTDNNQRWNANNSAVLPDQGLSQVELARLFLEMVESQRGEPGIFSRQAALATMPSRRKPVEFGTNPCGEIVLRPFQFCNLTAAVARPEDIFETLKEKVEVAAIIGTIQSLATNFPGLRPIWQKNCEEERLLGVDITGQMDSPVCWDPEVKAKLRAIAVDTNRYHANLLGINQAAAVTCVKPSGDSSQLLACSSGLHLRWAPYYIRNARVAATSPVFKVLRDAGVPMDPENGQDRETANTWVIHFPVKSPIGALTRHDRTALEQCEFWLQNKIYWTEHNPSVTITYKPNEVIELMKWIYDHLDVIGGMAFLPEQDALYEQMPYVEITKEEYKRLKAQFPVIDFSKIYRYEEEDMTTAAQELACLAGLCEVDFTAPKASN